MNLLVFALVVVIIAALLVWAADRAPMSSPLNVIVSVGIILVAVLLILNRAGLV